NIMKLAVSTYSLARWRSENNKTLEQALQWIAESGVDAVEFSGAIANDGELMKRANQLRKHCDRLGLKIVSYCVNAELLTPPAKQRETVEQLKKHVDVTAIFGAKSMRH